MIQNKLGAACPALEVSAACSAFLFLLETAAAYFALRSQYKRILVVGCERMRGIVDWTDRGTCVIFGDGDDSVNERDIKIFWNEVRSDALDFMTACLSTREQGRVAWLHRYSLDLFVLCFKIFRRTRYRTACSNTANENESVYEVERVRTKRC